MQGFCNNAGILDPADWLKVRQVNLDGMLYGAMLAYERMGVGLKKIQVITKRSYRQGPLFCYSKLGPKYMNQ